MLKKSPMTAIYKAVIKTLQDLHCKNNNLAKKSNLK